MNYRLIWAVQRATVANGVVLADHTALAVIKAVFAHQDGEVRVTRMYPQEVWRDPDYQDKARQAELGGLYSEAVKNRMVPTGLPVEEAVYMDPSFLLDGRRRSLPIDTRPDRVDPWWQIEVTWKVPVRQAPDLAG